MFIRTVTLIKLVTLAGLALSPTFFDHVENPKVLTGPTVLAGSGSYSFTLESTGDVPANTTYSVTNSHPGWFLMPTNVTIPSGQHSVTFSAYYLGGHSGSVDITATYGSDALTSAFPVSAPVQMTQIRAK